MYLLEVFETHGLLGPLRAVVDRNARSGYYLAMLTKVKINMDPTSQMGRILNILAKGDFGAKEIEPGFYLINHFSFDHLLTGSGYNIKPWMDDSLPDIPPEYGVCDTPEQFIGRYKAALEASPHSFVVSFTIVRKSEQYAQGGWRWHKWGPYIGDKERQCEYLYDEPEIDQATVYHIYEILTIPEDPDWVEYEGPPL
jgi:hypothetical protein